MIFHSWLRHSWKSLQNRLTRDKKSLFTVTHALFFISQNILISAPGRCSLILKALIFLGMNSSVVGIPLTNPLSENRQCSLQNMFSLCPFNSAIVWNFPSIFARMHLCAMHYQYLWLNFCKGNRFGDIKAVNCNNALGVMGLECGPTACVNHQFTVTSQAWHGDPQQPGPWFNIKMSSHQYRKSHCGDKTILRPSYLHNGISYTGKMTSLYWIRAQSVAQWLKPSMTPSWCRLTTRI